MNKLSLIECYIVWIWFVTICEVMSLNTSKYFKYAVAVRSLRNFSRINYVKMVFGPLSFSLPFHFFRPSTVICIWLFHWRSPVTLSFTSDLFIGFNTRKSTILMYLLCMFRVFFTYNIVSYRHIPIPLYTLLKGKKTYHNLDRLKWINWSSQIELLLVWFTHRTQFTIHLHLNNTKHTKAKLFIFRVLFYGVVYFSMVRCVCFISWCFAWFNKSFLMIKRWWGRKLRCWELFS